VYSYAVAFAKSYGGTRYDVGYSVQHTSDGGYIMAGIFTPSASDSGDVCKERAFSVKQTNELFRVLIKTDPNGNLQWGRVYSNPSLDDEFGGAQNRSSSSQNEILVMKINSSGALQWVRWIRHIPLNVLRLRMGDI